MGVWPVPCSYREQARQSNPSLAGKKAGMTVRRFLIALSAAAVVSVGLGLYAGSVLGDRIEQGSRGPSPAVAAGPHRG